jgi:hypothetical protein
MLIIARVWYAALMCPDVEVLPTSDKSEILGDCYSGPQIYSPSRNMTPTIHFGSLVFEHDSDFNLKCTGIDDPDLTRAGREVFTSWGHPTEQEKSDKTAQLDLDFEDSGSELDPFESRRLYMASCAQTPTDEASSSVSRPPPCLSSAPTLTHSCA